MSGGTAKCPICGEPYQWYSHTVADQSACPKCVRKAAKPLKDRVHSG
jgi:endogenous inhibitor of DNA gyrase (YacG/DUF329 family)